MIQLISALSLPLENMENPKARLYPEDHRSESAIKQDELMPYIRKWFEDHSYCLKNFDGKQAKHFRSLVNRFIQINGRIYRRPKESRHRLFVEKKYRMYMMTAVHNHNGHRGFFATRMLLTEHCGRKWKKILFGL